MGQAWDSPQDGVLSHLAFHKLSRPVLLALFLSHLRILFSLHFSFVRYGHRTGSRHRITTDTHHVLLFSDLFRSGGSAIRISSCLAYRFSARSGGSTAGLLVYSAGLADSRDLSYPRRTTS